MSGTRVRPKHPSPPPPTSPPVVSPPPPPPAPTWSIGDPTGTIGGPLQIAYGRGAPWSDVNRYNPHFLAAGKEHGVPPAMLKAMAVIESGGQMIPNAGGSGAFGIMQIKAAIWGARATALGYDLNTAAGQIGMAAAILGGDVAGVKGKTPEERFLSTYYPTAGLDVPGEDGHTPRQYLADMHELMRQIEAAAGGTTPAPKPEPVVDVVDVIMGNVPYTDDYGFKAPTDLPYYKYFENHGGNPHQHTGIDAVAPTGTPLYSPISGTVVCAGTDDTAAGAFGTSCAAFAYTLGANTGTSGRFEILHDDGKRSLILGHVLRSVVPIGARVQPGQKVAEVGGENGPHCHIEARLWSGGNYTIVDPRQAFGSGAGVIYTADPVPVPQPDRTFPYAVYKALRQTPVRQRANPTAPELWAPLQPGDEFNVQHKLLGSDGNWWLVGRLLGRVLESDCALVKNVLS